MIIDGSLMSGVSLVTMAPTGEVAAISKSVFSAAVSEGCTRER